LVEAGEYNITMPPSVPRHTGQVLREVAPKDFSSKMKMKKDCVAEPDGVTKIWCRA
jgi:hypothetical protein